MSALLDLLQETSALSGANSAFVEELYERWLENPNSVEPSWRSFFERIVSEAVDAEPDIPHGPVRRNFTRLVRERHCTPMEKTGLSSAELESKQASVLRLINAYRVRGHQRAQLDPLGRVPAVQVPDLTLQFHDLGDQDLDMEFDTGSLFTADRLTLRAIIDLVERVYCGTIGSEYMHLTDTTQKRWIQERLESSPTEPNLSTDEKCWTLELLIAAEGLERYLHTRYVGQKRFSLEGGDSLIPLLDDLIQRAGAVGVEEVVLGMAHRGRLNVLTNILGKPPQMLFEEFEGEFRNGTLADSGDVKYHQGFSSDIETPGGVIHLALSFNPSHLEIINPVVQGSVRARQQRRNDKLGQRVLPILLHGDAAFAGQGVVMETLNMSQARGFNTGGTVHVITNNQIGFTTSNPTDARSTAYCTDVAKMIQAPIFHVNGDDPEAVLFVTRLALDYRMTFNRDVVVDLVCYRRQGHNEADEPAVTQPQMYTIIRELKTTPTLYAQQLIREGVMAQHTVEQLVANYRTVLASGSIVSRPVVEGLTNRYASHWKRYYGPHWTEPADTSVDDADLQSLAARLLRLPTGMELHARVRRIQQDRAAMMDGALPVDWGMAELLAYASLLNEGCPVRLTGQDSGRGTFFHRHAVLHDQKTGKPWIPLQHLGPQQANFLVVDSLLSEEAVLGFEYGYATADPDALVLWEAQFGDFANGAQVVIDQFVVAGEAKWGRLCGLVMLLPHGYEGQGPEHSSARLERYLQLSSGHNIQVCIPTTPAQMFHVLRRQYVRPYRKPLIIMSSKSLLRYKDSCSPLDEFTSGQFNLVLGETDPLEPGQVKRVILCSGKVYYDLLNTRRARNLNDVAILRVEQLYPFPRARVQEEIKRYSNATTLVWCQEEPHNQGAWDQIKHRFRNLLREDMTLRYAGRPSSPSPAVGNYRIHQRQQEILVAEALTG